MFQSRLLPMLGSSKTTKIFVLASLLVVFGLFIFIPQATLAQTDYGINDQFADTAGLGTTSLITIIANIIRVFLGILGIILLVLIIYGGFIWMTAAGDPAKVEKAKNIIQRAIIGVVIILSAFAIVSFVLGIFSGGFGGYDDGDSNPPGPDINPGRWGIGVGPIKDVMPQPNEKDVPINTIIAVTFKMLIDPATIIDDGKISENIEICEVNITTNECYVTGEGSQFTVDHFADSTAATNDNTTFVFIPNNYLGAEDFLDRRFRVKLKSGIKTQENPDESVFNMLSKEEYYWDFTTNGEFDLDPPEIVSVTGVYPNPDNSADIYEVASDPTAKTICLTGLNEGDVQSAIDDSYTQPVSQGDFISATLSGTYGGTYNGIVTVTMSDAATVTTNWVDSEEDHDYSGGSVLDIGSYGLTFTVDGVPLAGSQWKFDVTASQEGTKVEVVEGGTVTNEYTIGDDLVVTTGSVSDDILEKLNELGVFDEVSSGCISTTQTGEQSNNISVRFSGPGSDNLNDSISSTPGTESSLQREINGLKDPYRNTIFQVNFNEPINPLTALDTNFIIRYTNNSGNMVALNSSDYTLSISNNYRTVELEPTTPCGVKNSCGEEMYCWPINTLGADELATSTSYIVSVLSASLMNLDPSNPNFSTHQELCDLWGGVDSDDGTFRCEKDVFENRVYYPMVADPISTDGVSDRALNSFNGSFNIYTDTTGKERGLAEGFSDPSFSPGSSGRDYYSLNYNIRCENLNTGAIVTGPNCLQSGHRVLSYGSSTPSLVGNNGFGDTFRWSFWLSSEIDIKAPLISTLSPQGDSEIRSPIDPIQFNFDRLIRSSTLKPGWNYGDTLKDKSERYLGLRTVTQNQIPVGYWVRKYNTDLDNDGWADYTQGEISHSRFDNNVEYSPLAGSGLQSITQNCFVPAGGPIDAGSGSCDYISEASDGTSGCVRDSDQSNSPVELPNPASFGQLNCEQIEGAAVCEDTEDVCLVSYYKDGDPLSYMQGSWAITRDYSTAVNFRTGCCFGKCVAKADLGDCSSLGGILFSTGQNCQKDSDEKPGIIIRSSDDSSNNYCCLGIVN